MKRLMIIFAAGLLVAILVWRLCFLLPDVSSSVPNLTQQWHDQMYGLDDDEVIRLVAPPFSPARGASWLPGRPFTGGQVMHLVLPNGQINPVTWSSKIGT